MPEISKGKILAGREAADAYREAHRKLHSKGWYKGISEDHTPLLNTMLAELKILGFDSLEEFFTASMELNIKEVGLEGKELTQADMKILKGEWH